jgi:hypothetical protein
MGAGSQSVFMGGCAVSVVRERVSRIAACAGIGRQPARLQIPVGEN